jgi:hypothetical protein
MQETININVKDAQDVKCTECDGEVFAPAFLIKRISALVSPTGQEVLAPIQIFQCSSCKHINKEFLTQ